ncbi:hypothetical protein VTK56DRAFT_4662 [Thermocarpiscus australiensis]
MPEALKKRKSCTSDDEKDLHPSGTAKKRRICKLPAGRRRPRSLSCPKNSVSTKFVNASAKDTDTTDLAQEAPTLSSSLLPIVSENRNVRDGSVASTSALSVTEQEGDADSLDTDTPLSSLFDPESAFQDESLSEISIQSQSTDSQPFCKRDSFSEPLDSAMSADIAAHDKARLFEELWTNVDSSPPTQRSVPMELICPELRDDVSSPVHVGGVTTKSAGSEGEVHVPTAIDEEENIWEVEKLLAKWKRGRKVLYLVKWKGFPDEENTWEKRNDINAELVERFEEDFLNYGGNHFGVELLHKRVRRGEAEYLVRWKGRPESDNSWEKKPTISSERIREFEVSRNEMEV